jgi:hypothetical protein
MCLNKNIFNHKNKNLSDLWLDIYKEKMPKNQNIKAIERKKRIVVIPYTKKNPYGQACSLENQDSDENKD